jgi:hypothetical protein
VLKRFGQSWPLRLGSAGRVCKNVPTPSGQERIFLKIKALVSGRDSGISDEHVNGPLLLSIITTKLNSQSELGT